MFEFCGLGMSGVAVLPLQLPVRALRTAATGIGGCQNVAWGAGGRGVRRVVAVPNGQWQFEGTATAPSPRHTAPQHQIGVAPHTALGRYGTAQPVRP